MSLRLINIYILETNDNSENDVVRLKGSWFGET